MPHFQTRKIVRPRVMFLSLDVHTKLTMCLQTGLEYSRSLVTVLRPTGFESVIMDYEEPGEVGFTSFLHLLGDTVT